VAPVRTLLLSTLYPSAARPGHGLFVETRLRELLRSGEVQARVVAPVPWFPLRSARFGDYARMAATPSDETRHGIEVHHPRYLLPPKIGMYLAPGALAVAAWAGARRLRRTGFDFDLIDAHYFYPDGVAAAMVAAATGRPFVVTARGSDLHVIGRDALARRWMRWAARRAAACIGVSQGLADVLLGWGLPSDKVHVLRNGVDLERFQVIDRPACRARLGVQGDPLVLSVGNLVEVKGHDLTLDAFAQLHARRPGARLVFVGHGGWQPRLEAQAQALGVAQAVRFAGARPQDELPLWYGAADQLVLASRSEGWANVLLEAMACGTPVVATDVGAAAEVLGGARVGALVGPREPAVLAQAIEALHRAPPARDAVRRHAERFSWQATSDAQLRLFREIVNAVPARRAVAGDAGARPR
jgi:teichuronic acid biosynthesis glycosyltransferase TuaC